MVVIAHVVSHAIADTGDVAHMRRSQERKMRKRELSKLMGMLDRLTRTQRKALAAELSAVESKAASIEMIESQALERPVCPHCGALRVVKNGSAHGLQRFKCCGCGKTFNALTGTPLAGLHLRGKWLGQATAMHEGLSLNQVAARLNIARSTAFRWRHRFLALPKTVQAQALVGIAEADEAYFRKSAKGQRGLPRAARRRGSRAGKRGTPKDEFLSVLIARDRSGGTANFILESATGNAIGAVLKPVLPSDTVLCSDGGSALAVAARALGVEHHAVNLSAGIRVDGAWHIQNVNAFCSRLRDWMRRFKGVSSRYLDNYLGWFRALDRSPGASPNPVSFLAMAIKV